MTSQKKAALAIVFALTAALTAPGAEKDEATLQSSLKATLTKGKSVPASGGMVPVEVTFVNKTEKEQKLSNTEYRIAILDRDGEQVHDALTFTVELRSIVLKGGSTIDRPGVFVQKGKLKAGQDYYLVVSVRNLIGHAKFTAK